VGQLVYITHLHDSILQERYILWYILEVENIIKYKGKCIGVITPSRHTEGFSIDIDKVIKEMSSLGIKVKIGSCFNKKYYNNSGTKEERVEEIEKMFLDKEVNMIMSSIGGDGCNQILDLINYDLIKNNPKPMVGFSDITNLILAINTVTGINTYHGPNLSSFSKLGEDSLLNVFDTINGEIDLGFNDFEVIKDGCGKGKLVGGNLFVINNLLPTKYSPIYDGAMLFWEDINEGLSSIEYQLYQLHLSGVLDKISGMIIGNIEKSGQRKERSWKDIMLELTKNKNYPLIKTDKFGHNVKKFITLPIGIKIEIDTVNKKVAPLS